MIRSKIRQVDPSEDYVIPGALLNNILERMEKLENLRGGGGTIVKDTGYGFRVWSQGGGGTETAIITLIDSPDSFLGTVVGFGMFYKGVVSPDLFGGVPDIPFNCVVADFNQVTESNEIIINTLADGTTKAGIPLNVQRVVCRRSDDPGSILVGADSYPLYELVDTPGVKRTRVNPTTGWVERTHMTFRDDEGADIYWIRDLETVLVSCVETP